MSSSKKDDRLKKLLQRAELSKSGPSFTEGIMAEIQSETVFNPVLKSILKNLPIENPQVDFTKAVMDNLEAANFEASPASIISKKVWYIISGLVIIIVAFAFYGKSEINHSVSYVGEFGKSVHEISRYLGGINLIFIICLSSVSCLLLLDYFFEGKVSSSRK